MAFDLLEKDLLGGSESEVQSPSSSPDMLSTVDSILGKVNSILEKVEAIRSKAMLQAPQLQPQPLQSAPAQKPQTQTPNIDLKKLFKTKEEALRFVDGFIELLPNARITTQDVAVFIQSFFSQIPAMQLSNLKTVYAGFRPLFLKKLNELYGEEKKNVKPGNVQK